MTPSYRNNEPRLTKKQESEVLNKLMDLLPLLGKELVRIELHPFDGGDRVMYDPVLVFSGGERLRFHVQRDTLGRSGAEPRWPAGNRPSRWTTDAVKEE